MSLTREASLLRFEQSSPAAATAGKVQDFQQIRLFLAAIRRRLVVVGLARTAAWVAVGVGGSWLVLALLASWLPPSATWRLLVVLATLGALAGAGGLVALPLLRLARDETVARFVGGVVPPLRSDLLSAVELEGELDGTESRFSAALVRSLAAGVARALHELRPAVVVPVRPLAQPLLLVGAVAGLYALSGWLLPGALAAGFGRIFVPPQAVPSEAAEAPIIADIVVSYRYPAYTGLAPRTFTASSGDLLAPRGTVVRISARPLVAAEAAEIEIGERKVAAEVKGGVVTAELTIGQASTYRFVLKAKGGRRVREAVPHRIELEPDRPPRVEIYAPADDLEIAGQRKIELGYQADDDYGVTEVALVWRIDSGREMREVVRRLTPAARNVSGRMEWDLGSLGLRAGARIAYRFEARDNDTVAGPNFGSSRTLYLKIYSAREKHDGFIKRQEELLEGLLAVLADRLERAPAATDDTQAAAALRTAGETHRRQEALAAAAARLAPEVQKDAFSPKDLGPALAGMGERLGGLLQREAQILEELTARARRGNLKPNALPRLRDENGRHVTELEKDAITLDDLLGRQRLENLVALADELTHSRDRLKALLEEYRRTHDESVRREIERTLSVLEARVQELQSRLGELASEVPDEFLNREAIADLNLQKGLGELRDLLEKGDVGRAQSELERLSRKLDDLSATLDQNLRGFRQDRFPAEERALSQMLDRVGDLHAAQQEIARETKKLVDELRQRSREVTRDRLDALAKSQLAKVERLKQKLAEVRREGLGPYHQEELERSRQRVEDLRRALDQGDLEEALEMARGGALSLRTLTEDLRDEVARAPWRKPQRAVEVRQALDRAEEALPLANEIAQDLERALPRPEQLLDADQRRRLGELAAREREVRRRAARLGEEARAPEGKAAGGKEKDARAPGLAAGLGEEAEKLLREAANQMQKAEGRLRGSEPRDAHQREQEALESLGKLRDGLKRTSKPRFSGFAGEALDRSPVRIPGSDEHRSPREFRQDLLDAMKEAAPAPYREQVRRYYEELVR
jgi:hypothetical protein